MIMNLSLEILEEFSVSNDQMIVKGKRTKRPRSSSSASSSGVGGGEFYNNSVSSSPPASTSTEEDEDMANCLILLARGRNSPPPPPPPPPKTAVNSRKFTEIPTAATGGKVGIYVYECKTCNRSFPSFQALGGHRASHKKPKPTIDIDPKKSPPSAVVPPSDDQESPQEPEANITVAPPPSTQFPIKSSFLPSEKKNNKIHECSICGSEFASGQALGGHMRRHRSALTTANGTRIDTNASESSTSTSNDVGEKRERNILQLDLNLPAPAEDDGKFQQFAAASQKPHLVFSAAPLVGCHY